MIFIMPPNPTPHPLTQAYQNQFKSGFKAAESDEAGFKPNARIIEEKKRKDGKKSRWE